MHIITTKAAIDAVTDPPLHAILDRYTDMMDLAQIFVIQPGDTLATLAVARHQPFELWEFITSHPGGWYEAVFVLSDDGAGHVVLVPDRPNIDPALLDLCRANASALTA
jgi:hypothetical protein